MFLSVNWLKEYIDIQDSINSFTTSLSASGSHVESIDDLRTFIKGVVTAKITAIKKHENADKLSVCEVDFGDEKDVIVTAAKNMSVGDVVGVARPGAELANNTKIESHDFRGVISNGMFISFEEIGFSKDLISKHDRDGLLILPQDTKLGVNIFDALNYEGVIELEITPNRPDCLSVIGMAVETQATIGIKRRPIELINRNDIKKIEKFEVINNSKNVDTYVGGIVRNIQVKESPLCIKLRLMESGIRPVNNIVDITNYVMLETGLPLHAFDLDKIKSNKIVLREEVDADNLRLLDGQEVSTGVGDILITNGTNTIALAGIMGLENSEIDDKTRNIFIEGAHFDRSQIRKTAKRLGVYSEAASRFQKNLDPCLPEEAVLRALTLMQEQGFTDIEYENFVKNNCKKVSVETRVDRVNSLLGTELSGAECKEILDSLEIPTIIKGSILISEIPSNRLDLSIEADIIEEIGRIYGYEKITAMPISTDLTVGYESELKNNINKIRKFMQGSRYMEVLTYSFVGPSTLSKINLEDKGDFIKIKNPLGEEFSIMRPTMNAHFLEIAEKNQNRSNGKMNIFEIGHVFDKVNGEYRQRTALTILKYMSGDYYAIKNTVESILDFAGINEYSVIRSKDDFYHPGRSAEIYYQNNLIAKIGQVHPVISKNFGLDEVYMANIDIDLFTKFATVEHIYVPQSKFPTVNRELSIVIKSDIMYAEIESYLKGLGIGYVNNIYYADEYHDESLNDNKSLTIGVNLGSYDGTLKDEDIKAATDKVLQALIEKFDAKLR